MDLGGDGLSTVVRIPWQGLLRLCGGSQGRLRSTRKPPAKGFACYLFQSLPRAAPNLSGFGFHWRTKAVLDQGLNGKSSLMP